MNDPAPVLDYAPAPQKPSRRYILPAAFVLCCAIFGSFLQGLYFVPVFTAVGFLQVQPIPPTTVSTLLLPQGVAITQQRHAAAIPAAALTYLPVLKLNAAQISARELSAHLKVTPIPQSKLISVAYTDRNPRTAALVANTVMTNYATQNPTMIVLTAMRPTVPQGRWLYRLTGAAAGAFLGLALLALRRRSTIAQRAK
jgi:hypothetical protein